MVRNYVRKTDRAIVPHDHILSAIKQVLVNKMKVSKVAIEMSIPRRTLTRYVKKASEKENIANLNLVASIAGYVTKTVS